MIKYVQYIKQTTEREKTMILGQEEVRKVLVLDAKTLTVRQIAKKYNVTHHANIHNWLQGRSINVQMLEINKKKTKVTIKQKRKAKGKK